MIKQLIVGLALLGGCDDAAPIQHAPASSVEHPIAEADLPIVHLAQQAVARLGIETTVVEQGAAPRSRLVGGEVVVPPGKTVVVTAPVAGLVHHVSLGLSPGASVQRGVPLLKLTAIAPADRDTRARVEREVAAAEANLAALELRVSRNQALLGEHAGSARALEESIAAREVARADVNTARSRAATLARDPLLSDVALSVRAPSDGVIRSLAVTEGQTVAASAPLFELVAVESLQVRVPVYSGDIAQLETHRNAWIQVLGTTSRIEAPFSAGPPTAEPDRATVDRYLTLPKDTQLSPGQRVLVELPLQTPAVALSVPASAVVLDAWGGAWVYTCDGQNFARARVDPIRRLGERMLLEHGPKPGSCIVHIGAVELFGAEFPSGH